MPMRPVRRSESPGYVCPAQPRGDMNIFGNILCVVKVQETEASRLEIQRKDEEPEYDWNKSCLKSGIHDDQLI